MTSLIPYTRPPATLALGDRGSTLEVAARWADAIAGTDFVPKDLRSNPAAIAAAILYGDEVGLGPMMSMSRIAVINGRPTLAAEAQRALILKAGHDIWIEETTTTRCTVAGRRRDSEATSRVTWTMDDAKRAQLAGKQSYRMYPRQMLLARASAELARAVFPDAIGGLAATEELEDEPQAPALDNGHQPEPAPTRRRRRANVTAPATSTLTEAEESGQAPPVPGDTKPTQATTRRLHMQFRERSMERPERIAWATKFLGRQVTSFNDLNQNEADRMSQALANDPIPYGAPDPKPAGPSFQVPPGIQDQMPGLPDEDSTL